MRLVDYVDRYDVVVVGVTAALIGGGLAWVWFTVLPPWLALLVTVVTSTLVGCVGRSYLDRRRHREDDR